MQRPVLIGLFAALSSSLAAQQLWLARNDNTTYGAYAVGWPSSVIGFRFTASGNGVVAAAQVFTGNQTPAAHSLELRDHDLVTGLPGNLLGGQGSFTSTHVRCWQGAVLPQPVVLTQGQDYWLVWRVSGMFPQHSVSADNNPANVLVETRYSDGSTWHAQAMTAGKFRLFAPYQAGTTSAFGTAKAGQYGNPTIGLSGWPALGSPIDVWLDNAALRQTAVLVLGLPVSGGIPFPFGTSYTTANATFLIPTELTTSPTSGNACFTLQVPNLPAATGFPLTFQWGVLDPAAAQGIAHTSAVTAVVQ